MTTHYTNESSPLLDLPALAADPVSTREETHMAQLPVSRVLVPAMDGASAREVDESVVAPAERDYGTMAVAWVVAATAIRIVSMNPIPLGNGEAYYYSWSRFLGWSYYDHPPLIAWMVRLTTLFGHSPAAVRLGPILAAAAFGLLFYRLAERLFRPRTAFFALVIVTALPVFLATSFIVNPEAPMAPLWVAFLLSVEAMRRRNEWWRPLVAGAFLGLAFLAKYTAVLLVPAVVLYLALSPANRRWLRRPSFYAGGAVALLLATPVLAWNFARNWPSIQLHLVERAGAGRPVAGENTVNQLVAVSSSDGSGLLQSLLRVLVGQLISYSPLLAPLLVAGLVRSLRRVWRDDRDLFLQAFTWPVLLPLLAAMTRFKDAEQHWTMVAFLPAVIATARFGDEGWDRLKAPKFLAFGGLGLSALLFLTAHLHFRTTALVQAIPEAHYDPRADMINELIGWDQVRAKVAQIASATPGQVVLASNHYSMCGRLLFETGDAPNVFCPTARRSAFDFFGRHDIPANATAIVLTNDIHSELPAGVEGRSCSVVDQVDVERMGRRVARYFVQSCAPARAENVERAALSSL